MQLKINQIVIMSLVVLSMAQPKLLINAQSNVDTLSSASIPTEALKIIEDPLTRTESMLHTAIQIQIYHPDQQETMDKAIDYIQRMEQLFSTNIEGSDINNINQSAGKAYVKVAPETFELIQKAIEMAELSQGKFDPTIGAVTNLWKIGDPAARVPAKEEIEAALKKINYRKILMNQEEQSVMLEEEGMVLELGGISKGYIGSGITRFFKEAGITSAIINLGGNVIVMGTSPTNEEGWNVGVQDPDEVRGTVVGTQRIKDYAIITSGIYERYLEVDGIKYHHIINPKTGYPLENDISGVTVFAPESVDGDALSTSLFLFGIEDGMKYVEALDGVEAVFIDKDHQVYLTRGLRNTFKLTNEEYKLVN